MRKPLLLFIFVASIFASCNSKDGPDSNPPWNDSYIQGFISANAISVEAGNNIYVDFALRKMEIDPKTPTEKLSFHVSLAGSTMSADDPKSSESYKKYSEYITLLEDNGFSNREYRYYGVLESKPNAIVDTLKSISITCNKDFNEENPANKELSSLFTVFYDNHNYIVRNNYNSYTGENAFSTSSMAKGFPYAFTGESLSTIKLLEKPFISSVLILYTEEVPQRKDEYIFKIKITQKSGKVLEATCKYVSP